MALLLSRTALASSPGLGTRLRTAHNNFSVGYKLIFPRVLSSSYCYKSLLPQNGPGLKEFINSDRTIGNDINVSHYDRRRIPYLPEVDVGGQGRKGMRWFV